MITSSQLRHFTDIPIVIYLFEKQKYKFIRVNKRVYSFILVY